MVQEDYLVMESFIRFHIPRAAREYCLSLFRDYPFTLLLKPERQSLLGNYRYIVSTDTHVISVNKTLNPHAFLITYLHEVAHLLVKIRYNGRPLPHGKEWKKCFAELLKPVLSLDVFPTEILTPLIEYAKNPKASSMSDKRLAEVLHPDLWEEEGTKIVDIPDRAMFKFRKRIFLKLYMKRSRCLCKDTKSGKNYLISGSLKAEICL